MAFFSAAASHLYTSGPQPRQNVWEISSRTVALSLYSPDLESGPAQTASRRPPQFSTLHSLYPENILELYHTTEKFVGRTRVIYTRSLEMIHMPRTYSVLTYLTFVTQHSILRKASKYAKLISITLLLEYIILALHFQIQIQEGNRLRAYWKLGRRNLFLPRSALESRQ